MEMQRSVAIDVVDLESGIGRVINQDDEAKDVGSSGGQGSQLLDRECSASMPPDGLIKGDETVNSATHVPRQAVLPMTVVEALLDRNDGREEMARLLERKMRAEKMKKKGCKKPPKPPRPPKSPSLDAADLQMIKEISELAIAKQARLERMKERMKKRVNNARPSSNSNFYALVVTILFCLVIIWQGAFSQGN